MADPVSDAPQAAVRADDVWERLASVADPEIPVVSVVDLGIIRGVDVDGNDVVVGVAPTYSGCPATEVIEQLVTAAVEEMGVHAVIKRVLSPPWTTDWITETGRDKLEAYGIAPPAGQAGKRALFGEDRPVACPRCKAVTTTRVSEFGSTACKASYKCDACLEPFEYFKCI